jgi:hypothetical protein
MPTEEEDSTPNHKNALDDYSEFCGFWTAAELRDFEAASRSNTVVDSGDWN